jgi:hypothetical protein
MHIRSVIASGLLQSAVDTQWTLKGQDDEAPKQKTPAAQYI